MGLIDRLTGRDNPEYKKALDAAKSNIQAQGAAVQASMQQDFADRRAEIDAAHTLKRDALDQDIAALKQQMADGRRMAGVNSAFNRLEMGVSSRLQMALMRTEVADPRAATEALRGEIGQWIEKTKGTLNETSIAEFEAWSVSKAGERYTDAVRQEFTNLRERLREQEVNL